MRSETSFLFSDFLKIHPFQIASSLQKFSQEPLLASALTSIFPKAAGLSAGLQSLFWYLLYRFFFKKSNTKYSLNHAKKP